MNDPHEIERRLKRYRPASPSADLEARFLHAIDERTSTTASRGGLSRHAYAVAASLLLVASVALLFAGRVETARLRAGMPQPQEPSSTSQRLLEQEFEPEALAFKRQFDEARAAARLPRHPMAISAGKWEESQ